MNRAAHQPPSTFEVWGALGSSELMASRVMPMPAVVSPAIQSTLVTSA